MKKMLTPSDFQKVNDPMEISEKYDWEKQCRGDMSKWGTYASTNRGWGTGIQDTDSISD